MPHIILPLDVHNGSIRYYANSRKGAERLAKKLVPMYTCPLLLGMCLLSVLFLPACGEEKKNLLLDTRLPVFSHWMDENERRKIYTEQCFVRRDFVS